MVAAAAVDLAQVQALVQALVLLVQVEALEAEVAVAKEGVAVG